METDNNNKKKIIKGLLTDPLTQERKRSLSQLEPVENEMKKQWQQLAKHPVNPKVKRLIWGRIQRKCNGKDKDLVHKELW